MDKGKIRKAFETGALKVKTVNPETGEIGMLPVADVLRHVTPHKEMVEVSLENGALVHVTEDHSLFVSNGRGGISPIEARQLQTGSLIAFCGGSGLCFEKVLSVKPSLAQAYTYDLSVPGPENFVLANGIVAHNSYSIGGVSLDISKADKYQSLAQMAETQMDKATETKKETVKFIKGLSQPRFGIGLTSAMGPRLGKGTLSPKSFIVLLLSLGIGVVCSMPFSLT